MEKVLPRKNPIRVRQASPATCVDALLRSQRLLRAKEVSGLLAVSPQQVYALVDRGSIPCYRIGGSIRFDPSEIANWLLTRRFFSYNHDPDDTTTKETV